MRYFLLMRVGDRRHLSISAVCMTGVPRKVCISRPKGPAIPKVSSAEMLGEREQVEFTCAAGGIVLEPAGQSRGVQ